MIGIVKLFMRQPTGNCYILNDFNRGKLLRHSRSTSRGKRRGDKTLVPNAYQKYHPDIHGPNKLWAESKTKVIIQAYKTLFDSTTREQYDRLHSHHLQNSRTRRHTKKKIYRQKTQAFMRGYVLFLTIF